MGIRIRTCMEILSIFTLTINSSIDYHCPSLLKGYYIYFLRIKKKNRWDAFHKNQKSKPEIINIKHK